MTAMVTATSISRYAFFSLFFKVAMFGYFCIKKKAGRIALAEGFPLLSFLSCFAMCGWDLNSLP